MKTPSKKTIMDMDWFHKFYEQALPKKNPKMPTEKAVVKAATLAYDKNPSKVPHRFNGHYQKGFPPAEKRRLVIHNIAKWALERIAMIERYMLEEKDIFVAWCDGDNTSKGKRIVPKGERYEEIARAQGLRDSAISEGMHECQDFRAEHINRLYPGAMLTRQKLVTLPIAKQTKPKK